MVKELTKDLFSELIFDFENNKEWAFKGERPSLVKFGATWCAPCKYIAPILDKLSDEYDGRVDIYDVDVDNENELSAMFGVRSIPTLLFIPMDSDPSLLSGSLSKDKLVELFSEVLKVN